MAKKINNSISESHCSFKVSKLLKEKGPNCQCDMLHIEKEKHGITTNLFKEGYGASFCTNSQIDEYIGEYGFKGYLKGREILAVPTHTVAIEWLRVNFDMYIWIEMVEYGKYQGMGVDDEVAFKSLGGIKLTEAFDSPQEAMEAALLFALTDKVE